MNLSLNAERDQRQKQCIWQMRGRLSCGSCRQPGLGCASSKVSRLLLWVRVCSLNRLLQPGRELDGTKSNQDFEFYLHSSSDLQRFFGTGVSASSSCECRCVPTSAKINHARGVHLPRRCRAKGSSRRLEPEMNGARGKIISYRTSSADTEGPHPCVPDRPLSAAEKRPKLSTAMLKIGTKTTQLS